MDKQYKYAIGETGNEQGHLSSRSYATYEQAERAAKRAAKRDYDGDGWYKVVAKDADGHYWGGVR